MAMYTSTDCSKNRADKIVFSNVDVFDCECSNETNELTIDESQNLLFKD